MEPKFKIGDHISYYDSYWGRRTGIIVESLGIIQNMDGPGIANFVHRFVDDANKESVWTVSEKKMKICRKTNN